MFKSMDKVLSDNRKLDLEFEMMMASRLNYSEIFSIDSQEAKEVQSDAGERRLESQDFKPSGALTRQQWKDLLVQTISRGHSSGYECAICMSDIIPGNRRVVLLSCSHLYHQRCILNLESFMKTEEVHSSLRYRFE